MRIPGEKTIVREAAEGQTNWFNLAAAHLHYIKTHRNTWDITENIHRAGLSGRVVGHTRIRCKRQCHCSKFIASVETTTGKFHDYMIANR
jgi:hypothetical protein